MAKSDIFGYVNELEEEIQASRYARLSKTNKVIDEKIVMEIIEDIKNSLHDELDASIKIMAERDQIISAAEAQAQEIIKKARRDADTMIKQEQVYKDAIEKAQKVTDQSRDNAQTIRRRADQYAEEVFEDLEKYYRESLELIQVNKTRLYQKAEPTITTDEKEPEEIVD
ncbi:MAG: hypothetical protein II749_03715 [Clostridia bacterium]|jgi:F0F1-type ATP synthase membrane subunit b/b'|nr:hypothetical protein [Clostridia bacterium]MBR3294678.1 hypothetical protein [Clostridia bacterium]